MGYEDGWSRLHGGHRPAGLVGAWLAVLHPVARALAARRVSPDLLTATALGLAVAAVPAALAGGPYLPLAALLVLAGAVVDGLDGAVAVLRHRATRRGAILDSAGDRLAEAAAAVALWAAGAPGWLAATAAGLWWLHEYLRARAAAVGVPGIGVITAGERPTRVIAAVVGLATAWPLGAPGATAGAAAGGALALVGLAQLGAWLRRADVPGDDRGGERDER